MTAENSPETDVPLHLNVRCDSCGAQAKYLILLAIGRLFFCGHHFSKNHSELEALPSHLAIVNLETNSRLER